MERWDYQQVHLCMQYSHKHCLQIWLTSPAASCKNKGRTGTPSENPLLMTQISETHHFFVANFQTPTRSLSKFDK